MSANKLKSTWVNGWHALERLLLPPRCLLCGGVAQPALDLCVACQADLPRNEHCCARCAVPLPQSVALCGACQKHAPPWFAAWAPFKYGWPLNQLEQHFKFSTSLASGRALAQVWAAQPPPRPLPALIVPVPLHAARLRQRGYNQARELAKPLARHWRVPLASGHLIERVRDTRAQTSLPATERRRNMRGAFRVDPRKPLPDHVVVLDDVMTTGATLEACAQALQHAGVARVDVWALARVP